MLTTYTTPVENLDDLYSKLQEESNLSVSKNKKEVTNNPDFLMSVSIGYDSQNYDLIVLKRNKENSHNYFECWIIGDTLSLFDVSGWFKWLCFGRKSFSRFELILEESIGLSKKQQTEQDAAPDGE